MLNLHQQANLRTSARLGPQILLCLHIGRPTCRSHKKRDLVHPANIKAKENPLLLELNVTGMRPPTTALLASVTHYDCQEL